MTLAENNDNSAFVKRLRTYKNTCREIGWEPTCERRTANSKNENFDIFVRKFCLFAQGFYKRFIARNFDNELDFDAY